MRRGFGYRLKLILESQSLVGSGESLVSSICDELHPGDDELRVNPGDRKRGRAEHPSEADNRQSNCESRDHQGNKHSFRRVLTTPETESVIRVRRREFDARFG